MRRKYSTLIKIEISKKKLEHPRLFRCYVSWTLRMSDPQQSFHLAAFLGNDLWEKDLKAELRSRW